jgi:farnesyl diphosphate synthase
MLPADDDGFVARLARVARDVDERLVSHLDRVSAETPPRLLAAMRHAVMTGGKRFRPFLVIEMARLLGGSEAAARAIDVAAALECVHAYSLVHDDLPAMDNDELRRGQPTVWKAYDEWTAILAGDALLTLAFEIIARAADEPGAPLTAASGLALIWRLAAAAGPAGMVGGQMLDLEAEKLGEPRRPSAAHVRRLQSMKTGALLVFACEAGAIVAGASPEAVAAARIYGEALGLAFQISDDLLDVSGDPAVVGKAVGKDLALGKATLVAIEGADAARRHLEAAVARALAAVAAYGDKAGALSEAARFQLTRQS